MSLIVAQATDEGPRMVSDMRVLYPDGRRPKFKTDTLKVVVVAPSTTVCFAGDLEAGLKGVREFASGIQKSVPIVTLLGKLQKLASDDNRQVDFIVAMGGGDGQLTRIRSSGAERNLQTAWIGDQTGFELFQMERNKPLDQTRRSFESILSPAARAMSTLYRSMQAVIANPAVESVGGFCVAVAYKPRGFEYFASTFIYLERDIVVQPGDQLIGKMAQPVEDGGYAVSVVGPAESGVPALGLSFPRARIAILFLPLQFDGGQVIEDVPPMNFAKVIFERFGVAMKDPSLR